MSPSKFIRIIRESFEGSEDVYGRGSCVQFYLILKAVFPDALPYWSASEKHCVSKIKGKYYDITGRVNKPADAVLVKAANKISWAAVRRKVTKQQVLEKPRRL